MTLRSFVKRLLVKYPAEQEPDGNVLLPHHYWPGLLLMGVGFYLWQPPNPEYGILIILIGFLVSLDDFISHLLGWWTPLDALFKWLMTQGWFRDRYVWVLRKLGY